MSKKSKIIYLILTTVFFTVFNFYFSDIIMKNGFLLAENPVLDIVYLQNSGAAFNLFEGYKLFLIIFAFFALAGLIFYIVKHIKKVSSICLFYTAMLLSGIFSNMCERLFLGYVRDFIKLNFIDFPIFNISDVFINIGVLGLIIIIIKNSYFKK